MSMRGWLLPDRLAISLVVGEVCGRGSDRMTLPLPLTDSLHPDLSSDHLLVTISTSSLLINPFQSPQFSIPRLVLQQLLPVLYLEVEPCMS